MRLFEGTGDSGASEFSEDSIEFDESDMSALLDEAGSFVTSNSFLAEAFSISEDGLDESDSESKVLSISEADDSDVSIEFDEPGKTDESDESDGSEEPDEVSECESDESDSGGDSMLDKLSGSDESDESIEFD